MTWELRAETYDLGEEVLAEVGEEMGRHGKVIGTGDVFMAVMEGMHASGLGRNAFPGTIPVLLSEWMGKNGTVGAPIVGGGGTNRYRNVD